MVEPSVVVITLNRHNIYYSVEKKGGSMEDAFSRLVEELCTKQLGMQRVIIFCRSYKDVGYLYSFVKMSQGKESVDPIGAPDVARFRMVGMFTACTERRVKDTIVSNFTNKTSPLCVVIATVAFSMGLDSPNVSNLGSTA